MKNLSKHKALLKKKPKLNSVEQIIETKGGWEPGTKKNFDMALMNKDKKSVLKLIKAVPSEYRSRFSTKISSILK